jgi:hypothetical protein
VGREGILLPAFHRRVVTVLTALLLLFCLRVLAQLLQAWSPVAWLPPFEAWASGALPYWVLVTFQVLIVLVCARVIRRLHAGLIRPSVTTGKVLLILGSIYFGLMCLRLIIGLTVARDHYWFSARLPTFFHFVLAGFVVVYGWFHFRGASASQPPGQGRIA